MTINNISKFAATALMLCLPGLIADELPDVRKFTEITNQIWKQSTDANVAVSKFNDKEKTNEETRQDKMSIYKNSLKDYQDAFKAYSENQSEENLKVLQDARDKQKAAQAEVADVLSNKILGKIDFVNDMSQRFFKLSRTYNSLGELTGQYKDAVRGFNAGVINKEVRNNIVMVGKQVQEVMKLDPDNKALKDAMARVNKQAKLFKELPTKYTVEGQVTEQARILKNLSADLLYVKQTLEAQKQKLKMAIVTITIREAFEGLNIKTGELPKGFLKDIAGISDDIEAFESLGLNKDAEAKEADTSDDDSYAAFESLVEENEADK